jgi:hypothetical protein
MTEMKWYKRFHGTAFDPKFSAAAELSSASEDRGYVRTIDLRVVAAGLRVRWTR